MRKNTAKNRDALASLFQGGFDMDTVLLAYPGMGQPLVCVAHKMNELIMASKQARLNGEIARAAVLETQFDELASFGHIVTM